MLILSRVHCILQSFIPYMDKKLWMYTIVVLLKSKAGGNNTVRDVLREEKEILLNQAEALKLELFVSNVGSY